MKAFKQYKRQQGIGATRIRLGLSQQDFAIQLGVSRSLVSKVENRVRSLPLAALAKLSALETVLAGAPVHHGMAGKEQGTSEQAAFYLHSKGMDYCLEIQRLQYRLNGMEAGYQQLCRSLQTIETLLATDAGKEARLGQGFLQLQRHSISRKLIKCALPAQAALRQRIALLQAAEALSKS